MDFRFWHGWQESLLENDLVLTFANDLQNGNSHNEAEHFYKIQIKKMKI